MAKALGQLTNAPLIYVLAQIVFTRIPKMESLWEDFHQAIFDSYPLAAVERIRQIQLNDSADPVSSDSVQWNMLNKEKTEGVILAPDSLIFHATSYVTSVEFFSNLGFVLSELVKILPKNIEVNRLGVRYVDLLLPRNELPVDDQVAGKLGSISLDEAGCEFVKLEEVTSYKTPQNGVLVIRHRQSVRPDILPGDLFPNNLKTPSLLNIPPPEGEVIGLMDYDHYVKLEAALEPQELIGIFKSMHATSSQAFKAATTPEARKSWGEG